MTTCGQKPNALGTYHLTGDLFCSGDSVAMTANDVSLTLAGYTISSVSSPESCDKDYSQMGVRVDPGTVNVRVSGEPVGDVILFENAGGAIAYQLRHGAKDQLTFDPSASDGEIPSPHAELEQILMAHGLYPREAQAMVNTWRDSWLRKGLDSFYVVSRNTIDSIIPLDSNPAPTEVARVFVGRIELVTPPTPRRLRQGIDIR